MTTDLYLGQLRTIKRKIVNKRRESEMWRGIAESMSPHSDGDHVQSSGSQDKMATAIAKAVDYEKEAERLTQRLISLQHRIILQIDRMPTAEYSLILSEYYVHGMSLSEISLEWNMSYRNVKRKKDNALREFAAKYRK